ncbi:MAG: protein-L-isoaspartate(D-aspartate) O-methyltransferase [Pseudomonadota bacterium]|uniref:protein-L-isoaspartate(D-aspartate) O-methyltransferase n=1 Tax=Roseovarius salincola TaxID=2978479 RepID=UPI0022A83B26|nr:protein-L-isoaspartate(D-aspartate) O-methyltransferase [Roseovarius sp. EGI FJ00037]MCZ0814152.1 protein-L-isoaspartate(D-aspartate) O-methyltransferase [Roseovarius sp. EGI FJ00037]
MTGYDDLRNEMVERQIKARGVRDPLVLDAMRRVPRERFVPEHLKGQAYRDCPLPIDAGQTISQPYIVAYMIEGLALKGGEKVLEIGAGSGYAAAVMAEIAGQVFAIERHGTLASRASAALQDAGYTNVHIFHGDGTRGWEDEAPFDAILVSAGAPFMPETLKSQLATGGRMVVPIGSDARAQELVRVTRRDKGQFDREDLADVRFVPLIGEQGWEGAPEDVQTAPPRLVQHRPRQTEGLPGLIRAHAEAFEDVESAPLDMMMERIGDARVVLIGEASHGTSEFYRIRALITKRLIEEKGFAIVAAEADWPDAARIDQYVRHRETPPSEWQAFARFPTWMWRNEEVRTFADWLREWNASRTSQTQAGFYGLDLYSLFNSAQAIVDYLEDVDPDLARIARHRYGCLSPWEADPAAYGHAALTGTFRNCEDDVTAMLVDLMRKRQEYALSDGDRFLDAAQNAALVANAEKYYRIMYYGSRASWNLRDDHMFETLQNVMNFHGDGAKAVVWAHNSHIGDARATEMSRRGERNLGELCARGFGQESYRIGMGTDHGTVAAASDWNGPMEVKQVRPSHPQSYERQFHLSGLPGLILPLRAGHELDVATELSKPLLERAIGVIYRPETELASHYFEAELPRQFDEYVWIDETTAVSPLGAGQTPGLPETYPFGT